MTSKHENQPWWDEALEGASIRMPDPGSGRYTPMGISGHHLRDGDYLPTAQPTPAILRAALRRLGNAVGDDNTTDVEHADDVISALLLIEYAKDTMTHVRAWAVSTTYNNGFGVLPDKHSIMSGHPTREDAERWLAFWRNRYADRTDYDWHVDFRPVHVRDLRPAGAEPEASPRY